MATLEVNENDLRILHSALEQRRDHLQTLFNKLRGAGVDTDALYDECQRTESLRETVNELHWEIADSRRTR